MGRKYIRHLLGSSEDANKTFQCANCSVDFAKESDFMCKDMTTSSSLLSSSTQEVISETSSTFDINRVIGSNETSNSSAVVSVGENTSNPMAQIIMNPWNTFATYVFHDTVNTYQGEDERISVPASSNSSSQSQSNSQTSTESNPWQRTGSRVLLGRRVYCSNCLL